MILHAQIGKLHWSPPLTTFFFFFNQKRKEKKKEDKQPLSLPLQSFGTSFFWQEKTKKIHSYTSFKSHSYNYKDPIEEGKL